MFTKLILATVLIAIASPSAFAEDKAPPKKTKIETTKALEDNEQLLQFEIQSATSDQQKSKKDDKLGKFELQYPM